MHSTHHYHLLLVLLLTLGHVVAGDDQLKKMLVTSFVILDVFVLLILLWTVCSFFKRLKKHKTAGEKPFEVIENGVLEEHNHCEINEGVGSDEEEAIVMQEEGEITFVKSSGGFDLDDLLRASAEGLGKGSFGSCYKTMLDDDKMVVVKRLSEVGPLTKAEFIKYMRVLSAVEHPNLLPLLGYYYSNAEKLLLSNYARDGNLLNRIHGGRGAKNRTPFPWSSRLQVAQGVAQAMEFLHANMKVSTLVPHGNLKASNVLLMEKDKPLVCDYGLLPLVPPSVAVHKMVCYKSPEYQYDRSISKKTDVWSYGCLLLELITGRVSVNSAPGGVHGVELCNWVNRAVREEWTAEVFDAEILIQKGASSSKMIMLLKLALWCCEWSPEKRPEMEQVARDIGQIMTGEEED